MPRGLDRVVEVAREATDDREDYLKTTVRKDGTRRYFPTKLGFIVAGVIALALAGVLIF